MKIARKMQSCPLQASIFEGVCHDRSATEADENSIARRGDAARDLRVRHTVAGSPDRMWSYEPSPHRTSVSEGVRGGHRERRIQEAAENAS